MKALLYLENGDSFLGTSLGYSEPSIGEVVFNTSMNGYQEVFTDPSYAGQIVTMTYPLIGNYGYNEVDNEAPSSHVRGIIVREACFAPSHYLSREDCNQWFIKHKVSGIEGIDTRRLTKIIRSRGDMLGVIVPGEDPEAMMTLAQEKLSQYQDNKRLVPEVSTQEPKHYPGEGLKVVLYDFGAKENIIRSLQKRGADVLLVPYNFPVEEVKKYNPDGVMLSNGPGDPAELTESIEIVAEIQKHYPLFGICFGHQIFALANGAKTHKMHFGHRGGNHSVQNLENKKVYITAQNHGYEVERDSLTSTPLEETYTNANDGGLEGLKHKTLPCFSVQFHPEACPGPMDTHFLFDDFLNLVSNLKQK